MLFCEVWSGNSDFDDCLFVYLTLHDMIQLDVAARLMRRLINWCSVCIRHFGVTGPDSQRFSWPLLTPKRRCLQEHFLRLIPGVRALGIMGSQHLHTLRLDPDAPFPQDFTLRTPEGVLHLVAALGDLTGTLEEDAVLGGCADVVILADQARQHLYQIGVRSAFLGMLLIPERPDVVGVRVGIVLRDLLALLRGIPCDVVFDGWTFDGPSFSLPRLLPRGIEFVLHCPMPSKLDERSPAVVAPSSWWSCRLFLPIASISVEIYEEID